MKATGGERQQRGIQGIPIRSRDRTRPYQQIRDYIVGQISSGAWPPGHRLPPQRKWAAETGVAYQTMSRAIRDLVGLGILETRTGSGTRVAQGRRRRDSLVGAIGLVSDLRLTDLQNRSPFFGSLFGAIQDQLVEYHKRVVYEKWPGDGKTLDLFDCWRLVDGVVVLGSMRSSIERIRQIGCSGVPVVCIGEAYQTQDVYVVASDNFEDSRTAVHQLVQMGHTRIAAWAIPEGQRMRGFMQGLLDCGIQPDKRFLSDEPAPAFAERFASVQPSDRPSALFVGMRFQELNVLINRLYRDGILPGKDLYICSYDENLWNNLTPLGIAHTAIAQPLTEIARAAADMLQLLIAGKVPASKHVLLRSKISVVPATGAVGHRTLDVLG